MNWPLLEWMLSWPIDRLLKRARRVMDDFYRALLSLTHVTGSIQTTGGLQRLWHGPAAESENCISFKYRSRIQIGKWDAIPDPHMTNLITCSRAEVTSRLLNYCPDVADEPRWQMKRYNDILMSALPVTKTATRVTWTSQFFASERNHIEYIFACWKYCCPSWKIAF